MTLDVLICTIDEGILRVPKVLLPPAEGIRWVVSMQYTDRRFVDMVPTELTSRPDLTLTLLEGRGLSRNRNNAMSKATGDILLLADDDCRYTAEALQTVIRTYELMANADIICFAAKTYEGMPMKTYPGNAMSYQLAVKQGYYPSSIEISMKAGLGLLFDERFGLGSELLCAGEEDVLMKDALDSGYKAIFMPRYIVESNATTTGTHFIGNARLQCTKGATFRYVFGLSDAIWRTLKEAGWWFIHRKANPLPILYNMLRGIWILQ